MNGDGAAHARTVLDSFRWSKKRKEEKRRLRKEAGTQQDGVFIYVFIYPCVASELHCCFRSINLELGLLTVIVN